MAKVGAKCGVYLITNPKGKNYIGSSVDIKKRWRQYESLSEKKQLLLKRSLHKYGVGAHRFRIILLCSPEYRLKAERLLGDYYDCMNRLRGLNLMLPGYTDVPLIMSKEVRKKLSSSRIGIKLSQETKNKLSKINKGLKKEAWVGRKISAANKGRKHSKEHVEKVRIANTGRKMSEEQKERLRIIVTGRVTSEETKAKLSAIGKGRKLSEEQKKKMSERMKDWNPSVETRQKYRDRMSKKVVDVKTGVVFSSAKEAAHYYNINQCTLCTWLRGDYPNKSTLQYLAA